MHVPVSKQSPTQSCLCKQVKAPDGSWLDVPTGPDEAAVFLGAATEQATAGLLKAATYRVVGALALPLNT